MPISLYQNLECLCLQKLIGAHLMRSLLIQRKKIVFSKNFILALCVSID